MAEDVVRIVIDEDLPEREALQLAAEAINALLPADIAKSLRNPLPPIDRARARRQFLALQRDFRRWLHTEMRANEDLFRTLEEVGKRAGGYAAEALSALADRQHRAIRARMNPVMKQFYLRAFELGLRAGAAGRTLLPNEERMLERLRRNEYAYLDNFLTDLRHAEGRMPYEQRTELYVNALEEAYWAGYVYADLSPDRYVRWVSRGKDTCPDCAWMAGRVDILTQKYGIDLAAAERQMGFPPGGRWGNGIYSAQELAWLGVFPQSGALACTTQCHCVLRAARRPAKPPRGRPIRRRFRSLEPKVFTGFKLVEGELVPTRRFAVKRRLGYMRRAERTEQRYHPRRGRAR